MVVIAMDLQGMGSTSTVSQVRQGVVLKCPHEGLTRFDGNFETEHEILENLEPHPRIVKYLGTNEGDDKRAILLGEASHGDLQRYLDNSAYKKPLKERKKWCLQVAEAVAYIHSKGIVHSDLRPENFLLNEVAPKSLDILLCDFGGSGWEDRGFRAENLPDSGYFDPRLGWEPSEKMDIFSLGSVMYTILTGHWPYRAPGGLFQSGEEMEEYDKKVDKLFTQGIFPEVGNLFAGKVMMKCWNHEYASADEVVQDLQAEMAQVSWLSWLFKWVGWSAA